MEPFEITKNSLDSYIKNIRQEGSSPPSKALMIFSLIVLLGGTMMGKGGN